jgi:hypothetical protein
MPLRIPAFLLVELHIKLTYHAKKIGNDMMKITMLSIALFVFATSAYAEKSLPKPAQPYADFSGVYSCTGDDAHEGQYTGTVTMKLKPEHSKGSYASYDFKLEVPGYGTYLGHAAANGNVAAMHFALTDQSSKDYGTGIAQFHENKQGQLSFHKFYFEPEFKGGNTGLEDCTRQE